MPEEKMCADHDGNLGDNSSTAPKTDQPKSDQDSLLESGGVETEAIIQN